MADRNADADLLRDDAVVLVVDSTNDRRSGYYFITNALGTQADGRIADDGRSSEATWDAPWQFFQTNSAIERNNVQAVFVWRYLPPFGTFQIAYQRGTAGFGERSTQGNTLFVKTTTVF